ncbi:hypothetical protein [Thalassotalea sp. ND16A]|uniref:hypothetical protein n=1 Tax=Thalassotalea sp. ND16A TaxID=1535422 RepID=UPI00051A0CDF|nr:hypothetical protein [Thalassotalea sp. ND16A]KGJ91581.1 hypothetical protein ND16A_1813 [Thalassotalea sp. ND16A]
MHLSLSQTVTFRQSNTGWCNSRWSKGRRTGFLMGGLALVVAFGLVATTQAQEKKANVAVDTPEPKVAIAPVRHPRERTFMKRRWGVEVMYVRRTAAGYMLEFRYKVLDAEKSRPLFERQSKPVLTHTETGAKLIVPTPAKTGALRNSNSPIAGNTYWMFFANPGKLVQRGEHVDIEIGKFLVEGLAVK